MVKKTHKELDQEWSKLTLEYKEHALESAYRFRDYLESQRRRRERQKEAEKGKQVGKECTCLSEDMNSHYYEFWCSYCRYRSDLERDRSPG